MPSEVILLAAVLLAGLYMAWNIGANDVANAIGTSVGSGALTLRQAVVLAAIMEFAGAFLFGSHVSETIQTGIIQVEDFAHNPYLLVYGMLSALIAAGVWLQIASYYGWPVSTTHSIVGAIVGFGLVAGGVEMVQWNHVVSIVSSWVISPLLGGLLSYTIFTFIRRKIFYDRHPLEAAKRITPFLVFFSMSIMSMLILFHGLEGRDMGFWEAFGLSLAIGAVTGEASRWLTKRIKSATSHHKTSPAYGPEVALELDKAKKHLTRVQDTSSGELQYYVSLMVEEVENISTSLKQDAQVESDNSEYTAIEKIFTYLQMVTAALMAFAHGANDVANAIGPVAASLAILAEGNVGFGTTLPTWLLCLGGLGIVAGLATWGWRVIETIGKKITELTPTRGFCAELAAATTVVVASRLGMPISTTHTLVGAVLGIALARGIGALNLATTRDIVLSWLVTVPAGAAIAASVFATLRFFFA